MNRAGSVIGLLGILLTMASAPVNAGQLQAGAAVVDITPEKLPVLVNGGMTSRSLDRIRTRIHARALALSDGEHRLAIVVVDSCMMGRVLLDDVKALASIRTGIPASHLLISATHAHSAPASMGCLGTDADPDYVPYLRAKLVEAISTAVSRLEAAEIGFARTMAADFTALRQWIRRPDRIADDPFGNKTVRANMHAGANPDDVTGEAGPEDPELSLISVRTKAGAPLAVLANFSMHYFGDSDISADYFGLFSEGLKQQFAPGTEFVAMMSHGCSGDIWRRDYRQPESWNPELKIEDYSAGLVRLALSALQDIRYQSELSLAMSEERMTMAYRVPDQQRLEWAQRILNSMGDRLPSDQVEVYAREQLLLHEAQNTEIVVQALRIGDIAIATTPNETYAVTGLKIKAASPLPNTMVIELANGGDGYIPPPEQHAFGGYNTWAARSAGLEVTAEPRITQAAIRLLEQVTGQSRRPWMLPEGPAAAKIRQLRPLAWWRLNEFNGPLAADAGGQQRHAHLEPGITYYLEGPESAEFCGPMSVNRCPQFVGGRLTARLEDLGSRYTVSMWIWNGMPDNSREVAGWLYSRDHNFGLSPHGEHLGIGGTSGNSGKLVYQVGNDPARQVAGQTMIPRWTWNHVALVRDGEIIRLYLNGQPEAQGQAPQVSVDEVFLGGRSDNSCNWEGRLDEIAVFPEALSSTDIRSLSLSADRQ